MKLLKSNKGLTLLEVVISLVILAIVATGMLRYFGDNFTLMALFGNKSNSVLSVSEIMDKAYDGKIDVSSPESLEALDGKHVKDRASGELYKKDENKMFNFHVEEVEVEVGDIKLKGYNLTIVEFHTNDNTYVKLSSFIP